MFVDPSFLRFLVSKISKLRSFKVPKFTKLEIAKFSSSKMSNTKTRFQDFKTSQSRSIKRFKLLEFQKSQLQNSKIAKYRNPEVSRFQDYIFSISCFLEDSNPISQFFKHLLKRILGFVGACLSQTNPFLKSTISNFTNFQTTKSENILFTKTDLGCSQNSQTNLVYSNPQIRVTMGAPKIQKS